MQDLIHSGGIAPFILALTVFEILGLWLLNKTTQRGPRPLDLLPNILAGDFLLLAWWLSAAHWQLAAAALLSSLLAHLTDLRRRWP